MGRKGRKKRMNIRVKFNFTLINLQDLTECYSNEQRARKRQRGRGRARESERVMLREKKKRQRE